MRGEQEKSAINSGKLFLSLSTVASSILGLSLNLVLPFILSASEYSLFSIVFSFALLGASVSFEWIRVGIVRFANYPDNDAVVSRRSTLAFAYLVTVCFAVLGVLVIKVLEVKTSNFLLHVAMLGGIVALVQGVFSGQLALLRAEFHNKLFAIITLVRPILALIFGVFAAFFFQTAEAILIGLILSFSFTFFLGGTRYFVFLKEAEFNWLQMKRLFVFGIFPAIATNLSVAIPALMRVSLVAVLGLEVAGGMILVVDLGQRLFATLGSTTSVIFVQRAIHAQDHEAETHRADRIRPQLLALSVVVIPILCSLPFCIQPVAELVVPESYRSSFIDGGILLLIGMGIMSIRQYSIEPLFVVFGKTFGAPFGAAAMLAVLVLLTSLSQPPFVLPTIWVGIEILLASMIGIITAMLALRKSGCIHYETHDLLGITLGGSAVLIVSLLLPPQLAIGWAAISGAAVVFVYCLIIFGFNVLGLRSFLFDWLQSRKTTGSS